MFTHLHTHTEFSLLDGLSKIPALLDRAKGLGQEALAITDHGAMYGAIQFYKEARKRGIKPIIGQEVYVAPGSRHSRASGDKSPHHLTMLAINDRGYRNLMALSSRAHLEGYYYKPRLDRELLEQYHEGLVVLSGCPSSEIHRALQDGRWADAVGAAGWYREVFGGNFYVELQDHNDPQFTPINPKLVQLASDLQLPMVVTNDSHYTSPEDDQIHDLLLCIGTNSTVHEANRMRMDGGSYYLKSEEEMRVLFPELPQAYDNTWKIAEAADLALEFGRLHLPDPDLPPGVSPDQHLASICWAGAERLYPGLPEQVRQRLEYELMVVGETGFASYILIVKDFADFARTRNIPMGVRGSAAGSIILYCSGITDIDPLANRLVFERFLNLERREMPDIDMDFADDRRDEVIQYVAEKYGHDHVAQIITFGTLGAKAAIRDTGRALGLGYGEADRVARLIPTAVNMTIERALNEVAELNQVYEADESVKNLVDTARRLEGVARHASTHAAGVVISSQPLIENVPLQQPARSGPGREEGERVIPMTQYGMWDVAEIGLLKMDFLGLSNLTILARALDLIKAHHGLDVDLRSLPEGDAKTYEMLGRGQTFGVFQLESAGMRRAVVELQPSSIADLAALVALYRPGPMQHITRFCEAKHGRVPIAYPHPDIADILDETYGVIVYQDQVLLIAQKFAGYTLGEADIMRKAMGKKIKEVMAKEHSRFIDGAMERGYSREDAESVFALIEPFAGYAFNKAHAVCYGTIAFQTAYLKANFPEEYMTAVLMLAGLERVAAAAGECARLGIPLLPPDINRSGANFTIDAAADGKRAIRFGLGVVKNVGGLAAQALIDARPDGAYAGIEDFCRNAPLKTVNKRAVESLIKGGALDALGPRATLNANIDRLFAVAQREQRLKETGQTTMFDLFGSQVDTPMPELELEPFEAPITELLGWEKEYLGVYVSEHPFSRAAQHLGNEISALCAEIGPEISGEVVIAGAVTSMTRRVTREGKPFAVVELEDLSGSIELTAWSDVLETTEPLWVAGRIVLCLVRVRERGDRVQVSVQKAWSYQSDTGQVEGYDPSQLPEAARRARRPASESPGTESASPAVQVDEEIPPASEPPTAGGTPDPAPEARAAATAIVTATDSSNTPEPQSGSDGAPAPHSDGNVVRVTPHTNGNGNAPVLTATVGLDEAAPAKPTNGVDGVVLRTPAAAPTPRSAPVPASKKLVVLVHETEDEEADRERLHRLARALRKFPGQDEVRLLIRQVDGGTVAIAFGRADADAEISPELAGLTGVEINRE
ncbi:MAG: DNA polymerase III subunit alpha [Dehalococcoidia bacterium]|nr:DNA polymerase III subunit alpha [Dehalococcoidia bacterium]